MSFLIKNGSYWLQGSNGWTSQRGVAREFKLVVQRDKVLAKLKGALQPAPCAGAVEFFDGPYPNAAADDSDSAGARFKQAMLESEDE